MKQNDVLEMLVRTDPGRVREQNEDALWADAGLGLAILADGMGGYNAGEVASGMATDLLGRSFSRLLQGGGDADMAAAAHESIHEFFRAEIAAVNQAILHAAEENPELNGMGTTLVLACFFKGRLCVAHMGDSRLYCWRNGELVQLTRDHSLLQEQLDRGEISPAAARYAHNRNLLNRALGVEVGMGPEISEYPVQPDDIYLICSDGLTDMLEDAVIADALDTHAESLGEAADLLINLANHQGGYDNISLILIKVHAASFNPNND